MRRLGGLVAAALLAASTGTALGADAVKIGVLSDLSTTFSATSGKGSLVAAQLAVEDFGAEVLGRTIEITQEDHTNKADHASEITRRWISEGYGLVVDIMGSIAGTAVQDVIRDKNIVAVYSGAGATQLTGKSCADNGFVWVFDTYGLAVSTSSGLSKAGKKSWFFLTADYVFGYESEANAIRTIDKAGGKVLGSVKFPVLSQELSSYLLTAQNSGAEVIAMLAGDMANAVKQANEFGILNEKTSFAAIPLWINFAHAIGPEQGQGLYASNTFYWDRNDETRAWSKRYFDKMGVMPTMNHAGTYSGVMHYLKAVKAAGSTDATAIAKAMKDMPVDDATAKGTLRADGRLIRDYYVWQMKTPAESTGEWDLFKLVETVDGDNAAAPLSQSECPLVVKG